MDGSQRPKTPGARFSEKNVLFLKFIGLVKPLWILYPSEIMYMGSTGSLLVRAAFSKSIKVLRLQPGAPKSREHDFPKKNVLIFLKFIGPVTPLLALYPSVIMHLVFTDLLLASAVFARSIRVHGWQPASQNPGSTIFRKKNVLFFEIHRSSETSMGSLSLRNHVYGLYGIFTSQSSICKIN